MFMRIVVALGGNALGENLDEQMTAAKVAAVSVADLIEDGHEVILVHGNGPQVGMIETAFETAAKADHHFPVLPMSVCVALTQGYIGYDLQNVLRRELAMRGIEKEVCAVITQVMVDPKDPAFENPSKPIGGYMSEEEASKLRAGGEAVGEDSGRGWRRMVASPLPVDVVESKTVKALVEKGQVPIACGGGGIPVVWRDGQFHGVSAVVDKDRAAALLAEILDATMLVILTTVSKVSINFGKPDERQVDGLTTEEARKYMAEGQFGKGSMQPKIEAAIQFCDSGPGRKTLIAKLTEAHDALLGKTGTRIC
ncbi:MAG: carbamate kinase [Clostridiales Family XIII bacterium]|nr:carbamate kinase [Clostridiales Family XIII bacterium]